MLLLIGLLSRDIPGMRTAGPTVLEHAPIDADEPVPHRRNSGAVNHGGGTVEQTPDTTTSGGGGFTEDGSPSFPFYPFSHVLPLSALSTYLSSCIPLVFAATPQRWNKMLSVAVLCSRNPRTPSMNCTEPPLVSFQQEGVCRERAMNVLSCVSAFDTWLPCPGSTGRSTLENCAAFYGIGLVERWVPSACTATGLWPAVVHSTCIGVNCAGSSPARSGTAFGFDSRSLQLGDVVSRLQRRPLERPPYVPPEARTIAPFSPPVICRTSAGRAATFHGVNFGYPLELMEQEGGHAAAAAVGENGASGLHKLFGFSVASPKRGAERREYSLQDEHRLVFDMRRSMYAFTTRRWGWDCLRHVEQLGSGVIPLFVDLPLAPATMLSAYPRQELLEALGRQEIRHVGAVWSASSKQQDPPHDYFIFTGMHKQDGGSHVAINASVSPYVDVTRLDPPDFARTRSALLSYTRRHLSTGAIAASVLARMGHPEARKVLLLHGVSHLDFLKLSIHNGLVNGLGLDVVSYPRSDAHFQAVNVSSMQELEALREQRLRAHGNGYAYGMRTYDGEGGAEAENLERRIRAKEFDVVLFTFTGFSSNLRKQLPMFKEVVATYPPHRVGFLNGDDVFGPPNDNRPSPLSLHATRFGHVFLRELYPLADVCPEPPMDRSDAWTLRGTSSMALLNRSTANTTTNSSAPAMLCDLPTVQATPFPFEHSSKAAASTDVFLVDGEGNVAGLRATLTSIREHSRMVAPLVVLLVTSNASLSILRTAMRKGEFNALRPVVVYFVDGLTSVDELASGSPQRLFLAAVGRVLEAPLVDGIERFVVVYRDTPIFFRGDLFRSVGESDLWFARHSILSNKHHVGSSRYCFGDKVNPEHQHHIGHQLFGGHRGALLFLIAEVQAIYPKMNSVWCGYDAALNLVVHNGTFDHRAVVFSSERGPIVFDEVQSDAVCSVYRPLVQQRRAGTAASLDVLAVPCAITSTAAVVVGDGCRLITGTS